MKYLKATIAAWRRTGMNTIHYMMNVCAVIGLILLIACAFGSSDAFANVSIFIMVIGMTVSYSRTEAVNRYGIFFGGKKFESKGLIAFDERPHKVLQLVPFSREEAVRSFINYERFTNAVNVIGVIVLAAKAFTLTINTFPVIFGSILFIALTAGLYLFEKALLTYDIKIITEKQSLVSTFYVIFILTPLLGEKLAKSEFSMPVLTIAFAAAALICGIVFIIGSEKIHKQLIADCGSRSFTGEPIGGAE